MRAVEAVSRQGFLDERHASLVARDLPVPIAGGQTASPAWLVARMVEALAPAPSHRVLQVGAGSGYGTAVLAQLCAEVVALERVRGLAEAVAARLAALDVGRASVLWADGAGREAGKGSYDRILIHACCGEVPPPLIAALADGGVLVCAKAEAAGQGVVRLQAGLDGWIEAPVCSCHLTPLRSGLSSLG